MKPTTMYTKSGSINIAYQSFGSGTADLVYIPGWVSNIDLMWACPSLAKFLEELGKTCRVILFDKRGTGLSDRVTELSTLEDRMDDIRVVMDAVGSEKAFLFGHSEGGSVSALFAATYPQRTIALITFGIFAKRRYSPDYPWAPSDQERQKVYDMIEYSWGSGDMNLEDLAPSRSKDTEFMDWLAQYFRSGASPSAALILTKMNTSVDILDILETIQVPVLMMQRVHDIDVKIEEGRFISSKIKNAKFIEMQGSDHLFWTGDSFEVLQTMQSFIQESKHESAIQKRLATVLTIKTTDSKNEDEKLDIRAIHQFVEKFKGLIIYSDNEHAVFTFEGPSKAVHYGLSVLDKAKLEGKNLAICVDMMLVPSILHPSWENAEVMEQIDEMFKQSLSKHILITNTVKNLLPGAGLSISASPYVLKSKKRKLALDLFKVSDPASYDTTSSENPLAALSFNESFLEDVIQCIDSNLNNEQFNLVTLSRELAVSERQLQRKLKAISNKSPNQLISSVRLHRAKELLSTRKYGVSETAFQTGFSNPSYFAKCFKKEFGISPSSFLL
ncbi:alpha/beta fold hydrolase [Echinicola sp. 20G]|uniref:alpha/beta fold hydrolase n=1 Tax=Echinicola sp. 20G TaxID=2781961 RepID=UPI00190FDE42|nr:alpha/beta fold hydrolase [Echinicola sp. 20G]